MSPLKELCYYGKETETDVPQALLQNCCELPRLTSTPLPENQACSWDVLNITPLVHPPNDAYSKRHTTPRLTHVAENIRAKGLCKRNPVYDITGGSSVSPNPRNEVLSWLYHLGKKKKFPNFTVLFEVFKKLDFLTTRHLGMWRAVMFNSPNKCSEAPIQPRTW